MKKKWTKKEKARLIVLLRKSKTITEACRKHAADTGRRPDSVKSWLNYNIRHGKISKDVLPDADRIVDRFWSENETVALLKLVEQHPHNFSEAFRKHAENTGRSFRAVKQAFENYRKSKDAKVCMMTVGKKKFCINRKNIYDKVKVSAASVKVSKWKRILEIIFE